MGGRRDLHIGRGLSLPIEWMTMASVVYGTRGSGKSTLGRKIAEEVVNRGQRFCAIDPTGAWWGLKSTESGTDVGLPVIIFGGDHADVPLEPGAGSQIADVVAEIDQSTILDLEGLSKGKQIRFLGDFLARLYHINREPLLLLMDEAQRYAPQKPMGPEAQVTLGAAEDIVKLGRKHGIGPVVFTQRGSGLNKEVSELADVLIAFRTPGVLDQGRIKDWLEANATKEQMAEVMATISGLPTGVAIFASNHPDLKIFGPYTVDMPRSFDSSSTPKVGQKRREPRVLYAPDLEVLRGRMNEAIERAKAEDPKELRREIASLKRQLAERPPETIEIERIVEKDVPVPFIPPEATTALQQLSDAYHDVSVRMEALKQAHKLIEGRTDVQSAIAAVARQREAKPAPKPVTRPAPLPLEIGGRSPAWKPQGHPERVPDVFYEGDDPVQIGKAERAFLSALVQYPEGMTRQKLAILTGYKVTSGHISNTLSLLRTKGLIEKGDPLRASPKGAAVIGDVEPLPPPGPALVEHWMRKLGRAEQTFLRTVVDVFPDSISGAEIAERNGYNPGSGHISNTLSLLRTKGLVEGPTSAVRATEALVGG